MSQYFWCLNIFVCMYGQEKFELPETSWALTMIDAKALTQNLIVILSYSEIP
jgi:hypothetical protein